MRDNPLLALLVIFVPFSFLSLGGGPAIFAPMQRETVDVMHWLTAREFVDLFAIARTAPGPGAMLTTLIGWKVAGWPGAIVATLALFLPASILTCLVARVFDRYRGRDWHTALENGLAPVAVGLVFAGAISIISLSGSSALTWGAAIGAGLLLTIRPKLHPFAVLFLGALLFVGAEFLGFHGAPPSAAAEVPLFQSAQAQQAGGQMSKIVVEDVSLTELKQGLADGSITLIDVREPNEWAQGHIPGATLHPLSSFNPTALPNDPGKRVVLQCRSGRRTLTALEMAQAAGRSDIRAHFTGGMLEWQGAGEKVVVD